MIRLILYIIPESKYRKSTIWISGNYLKVQLKKIFCTCTCSNDCVVYTSGAVQIRVDICIRNIYNLNKMPHFLLSKYEISQVSVGGKGSAIEIYWKNQRG